MTTVTNTLKNEAGVPIYGIPVQIVLLTSAGAICTAAFVGETEVAPNENTVTDADGGWTLNLYANSLISPAGTTYRATHVISGGTNQVVPFVVPADGATPVTHHLSALVV